MFVRSRTAAILAAVAIGLGALQWAVISRQRGASFERRADQNVLLITIDTLRADALSSYGGVSAHAQPRRPRVARHAVRLRARARGADAAIPCEHPDRHLSVRERRPRSQRIPAEAGTPTIASMLKAQGFATGAFVGGVPLERRVRTRRRVRRLRRPLRADGQQLRLHAGGAPGRRGGRRGAEVDQRHAGTLVRVGPRVRSARAVRAAAAVRHRVCRPSLLR